MVVHAIVEVRKIWKPPGCRFTDEGNKETLSASKNRLSLPIDRTDSSTGKLLGDLKAQDALG